MERWRNCVAVVTGASSGIGAAIVKELLAADLKVAGLARRVELVNALKSELSPEQQKRLIAIKCDVSSPDSVEAAFQTVIREWGGVDILVNNAGVATFGQLVNMDESDILNTLKVNVMGVVSCTRHAFKSMKERKVNGHVLIINSTLGHRAPVVVENELPQMNIYPPSKYAVTAITEIYRQEFAGLKTGVRITSVSPGLTDTPIVPIARKEKGPILKPEDVAKCALFAISMPEHVQVHDIIVQANAIPT